MREIKFINKVFEQQVDIAEHTETVPATTDENGNAIAEHEEVVPATYKTVDVTVIPNGWYRYDDGGESFEFIKISNFEGTENRI